MKFVIACSMQSFSLFLSWLHVTLKLCSIVFGCVFLAFGSSRNYKQYALLWCTHCMWHKWKWKHFFHFKHTPQHTSPRHFPMLGRLLASTHSYMERWLSFAEVFRYFRRTAWEWVATMFVCGVHFYGYILRLLASPPCRFNGIWSICSWSLLQFVLFSFSLRFMFASSYYRFSVICLGATQSKDISSSILRYELFTLLR